MNENIADATGKLCPVPLVMTKKIYDKLPEGDNMTTLVDNDTSAKNVETFILESGGKVTSSKEGSLTTLSIVKGSQAHSGKAEEYCTIEQPNTTSVPSVIYIPKDKIGNGEPDDLGSALMLAFLNTIKDVEPYPSHAIFMHNGVKLLEEGSKTAEAVSGFSKLGIKVIACGTCLDYFGLTNKQKIGKISNMFDILSMLTNAGKIITP